MKKILLYMVVVFALFGCKQEQEKIKDEGITKSESEKIEVQQEVKATQFDINELVIMDFQTFEPILHKTDDKIRVVNFWATWCAPCVKELPYFEKLNKVYGKENVEVILVSLDFPNQYEKKLKPFIEDRNIQSRVIALNDVDFNAWLEKVDADWSGAIPATLIYSKDKRRFYEQSFDWEALENELKTFL